MIEWVNALIRSCEEYVKTNPITSAIIIGILTNLLTDLVKQTWAKTLTSSKVLSKFASRKLLERAIKGYELQLAEIEKFKNDKVDVLIKYVYFLLDSFCMGLFLIIFRHLIITYSPNPYVIWGFYGAGARIMFGIVIGSFVYQSTLYNLLYNIDKYEKSAQNIILRLKNQLLKFE